MKHNLKLEVNILFGLPCSIWGSQSYECCHLLGHSAVLSVCELKFPRNVPPPSSGPKISQARNQRVSGAFRNVGSHTNYMALCFRRCKYSFISGGRKLDRNRKRDMCWIITAYTVSTLWGREYYVCGICVYCEGRGECSAGRRGTWWICPHVNTLAESTPQVHKKEATRHTAQHAAGQE
jgi:hypothetical protein